MAIYHLNLRSIGRSTHAEGTAGAHVGYITRAGACRVVLGEHMPIPKAGTKGGKARAWLDDQEASDRKNARVIDKMNIALPIELDETERVELLRTFMAEVTGGQVPWVAAIHDKGKDAANPHGHVALRDRHIETGKRHIGMSERGAAERLRELWERTCNEALAKKGLDERIDRRGLRVQHLEKLELAQEWQAKDPAVAAAYAAEAQALDRKPQLSVGPVVRAIERKGRRSTVIARATRARESLTQRFWKAVRGPDKARTPAASRNAAEATRAALSAYFERVRALGASVSKVADLRSSAPPPMDLRKAGREHVAKVTENAALKAYEAEKALREKREAAERAERDRDHYAGIIMPLIQRARKDPELADLFAEHGIDLNRSDRDIARDECWPMRGAGFDGSKTFVDSITTGARWIDKDREPQRPKPETTQRPAPSPGPERPRPQTPRSKPESDGGFTP